MKIFALTDIHGRRSINHALAQKISEADLVLIAGDITQFGTARDAEPIIDDFFRLNSHTLAVSGNCDQPSVTRFLEQRELSLHGQVKMLDDLLLFGCAGSNPTPFFTPQEYTEDEMVETLAKYKMEKSARYRIFLTHPPPHDTKVDRTLLGLHAGSKAVRSFVEKTKPDLVICGHIHEAIGVDHIEETLIINPGPFPHHYALVNLAEKIEYELH